jgi:hypothetical protein
MTPEFHPHTLGAPETSVLLLSAAGVAVLHTLAGPDHYLPFVVMARARRWSAARTILWTTLCGAGHVGSSIVLAIGGVLLGCGLERIQFIEEWRGNLAAWAMIAFGTVYLAWGLKRAARADTLGHGHAHAGENGHTHRHGHGSDQVHSHADAAGFRLTPWVLFTIFVFGPCEPMIPVVMYPAARGAWHEIWMVVAVFSVLTIGTMLTVVLLARRGVQLIAGAWFERYTHATAGATILLAGCAIQFLGL